jgi:MSHA biogenesis protein MshE
LIRRLCTDCRLPHDLNEQDKILAEKVLGDLPQSATFYHQNGCSQCNDTGYKGRIGVYELLVMTHNLLSCLQKNDSIGFAQQEKNQEGFKSLKTNDVDLAMQGVTTLGEVMRIASDLDVIDETDLEIASD